MRWIAIAAALAATLSWVSAPTSAWSKGAGKRASKAPGRTVRAGTPARRTTDAPVLVIGTLSEQGTRRCTGKPKSEWVDRHFELGWVRLVGKAHGAASIKGQVAMARGRKVRRPRPPKVVHKGRCPGPFQMRSDWTIGMNGVRIQRGIAPVAAIATSAVMPYRGIVVKRAGPEIAVTLRNDTKAMWPDVTVSMHYEGCWGKPGSTARRRLVSMVKPGESVTVRFATHAGFGLAMRAATVRLDGSGGPVVFDLDIDLADVGARVKCRKGARREKPWRIFEGKSHDWGFKDARGKQRLPPRYPLAEDFTAGGVAQVADKKGFAVIDKSGRVLLRPMSFDNTPDPWSEGLARFVSGGRMPDSGKVGFYDKTGRVRVAPKLRFAERFHDGRAAFCRGCSVARMGEHWRMDGGRWGYIDPTGREVIAAKYTRVEAFKSARARVWTAGGQSVLIDRSGRIVGK